jgi:alkanesulfonate monooxygenase SsuD/methylene tetrahydromethanopterin reductase-like flavin-dependent oxidoreductase (luciferase family)
MTFGLHAIPQDSTIDELRRLWQWADAAGFDWISTADHFEEAPPQDGNSDVFEAVSIMAAIAAGTRNVRIGCYVFCVSYRNPGLLAKSLTTIDHLSGGRVECAIGAGWHEREFRGFGIPFARIGVREDQLEEYAQCLRMLFDQRVATFHGKHFRLEEARCNPKPVQPHLRIWIGGGGEKRTLPAAVKYADGWNCPYIGPDEVAQKNRLLDQLCAQHKRDPKTLLRSANVAFYMGADEKTAEKHRQALRQQWGERLTGRTGFLVGTVPEAIDMVGQYRASGIQRLSIGVRAPFDWDALHAYAEQVMPEFGVKAPGREPKAATGRHQPEAPHLPEEGLL